MTTRTSYPIVCHNCGAIGHLHMSENDAPFSKQYESYSISNLKAVNDSYYVDGFASWSEVFNHMQLKCGSCNTSLTHNNLKSSA